MVRDMGSVEGPSAVEARVAAHEKRFPLLVFFLGLWDLGRRGLVRLTSSEWLNWWPFWRQEKRLERLIAEADANPKDAQKQSALLAELNKHRFIYFFQSCLFSLILLDNLVCYVQIFYLLLAFPAKISILRYVLAL